MLGSFELFRASDDRPFNDDDADLVRDAGKMLARPLRRGRFGRPEDHGMAPRQTGVVLMDRDLHPAGITPSARAWFALLDARQKPEPTPLPIPVYGVVGRLLAAEAGEDPDRPPRVRVRTTDGRWAIVEAARLDGTADTIAVSVHAAGADEILPLVCRAYGLTTRERELVRLVVEGLDTREAAQRMFISGYTVKDHLKSVFDKLDVHSRRELVTGLLGQTT